MCVILYFILSVRFSYLSAVHFQNIYMLELMDVPGQRPNKHLKSSSTICFAKSSTSVGDVATPQWRCMLWTKAMRRWCAKPAKQFISQLCIFNSDLKHAVVIEGLIKDPFLSNFSRWQLAQWTLWKASCGLVGNSQALTEYLYTTLSYCPLCDIKKCRCHAQFTPSKSKVGRWILEVIGGPPPPKTNHINQVCLT